MLLMSPWNECVDSWGAPTVWEMHTHIPITNPPQTEEAMIEQLTNEQYIDILRDWSEALSQGAAEKVIGKEKEAWDAYTELALEAAKKLRGRL